MYKILLADDEGIAIESMKYSILQHFGSACDIRSAKNARQVFHVFQRYAPDIVFLNVQMSGIHGIYSIRKLHSIHPEAIYIVVSHTKKTNYNREGTYMHVVDYLKKPVGKKASVDALEKAIAQVKHERDQVLRKQMNKEKLQKVIPIIENGFIAELLLGSPDSPNLDSYRELLNIPAQYGWIMTLDFCETNENEQMTNPVGATIQLQEQQKLFRSIIKAFFPGAVIGSALANRVIVFIPCRSDSMTHEEIDFRQDRAEHMMKQLRKKMNLFFKLGIGSPQSLEKIKHSLNKTHGF